MNDANLTSESVQNYLKTIYQICQTREGGAPPQEIAALVGVSAPGVSKMLRHLAKHQFVEHTPYQKVTLTELGETIALEVIRHHRLIELYLMEHLGYGWDQVHSEAERLEHHISEEFENCIERLLNFPEFDPHGDPIPTRDGKIGPVATIALETQEVGTRLTIRRVTDEDDVLLRYLGERGIRPGVVVEVVDREPFGGFVHVRIGDAETRISPDAARHVFVEPTHT